ncbi:MAG: N-acetylglucosamine-specific PTS transporter subunit IIBC [Oscillospiraceae bacterium]|nr:N-acetylglucosamine-specific PTS transporter subunit IIBC [Oscillospiraceae bacterium]
MKHVQRLGRSLMLPVATLPIAALMLGIGYWIDPNGWGGDNQIAAFLVKAGAAIIDNMPILFAIGVAIGMADKGDGTSALAGLVSFLMITTLLSPGSVENILNRALSEVHTAAFEKIDNVFIGILSGLIGAFSYNRFKNTKLPDAFAFFSGKRSVAIVTGGISIVAAFLLMFIWPFIFGGLVAFGEAVVGIGPWGAAIYGFFNRLLIPLGLHHALNQVFWFDLVGINDLGNFWNNTGLLGETGVYMTGFFPVMMFGLPGAALAMYHTAKTTQRKVAAGILMSGALASFLTGVTEPIEFAFMFLAPILYVIHALLTAISMFIMAILPIRAGFNFSGGFIDLFLSARTPLALNPWLIIPIGLGFSVIYYALFRIIITKFNLKTPGREDEDYAEEESKFTLATGDFAAVAATVLEGLGGADNITSLDNCITRLRVEIKDYLLVDEKKIKSAGVSGVIRPSKTSVQVVVGTQVQHVADEIHKVIGDK